MFDIYIKANDVPLYLGAELTNETLYYLKSELNIKKQNFISKSFLGFLPNENVYFAKNKVLSLFNGYLTLPPNLSNSKYHDVLDNIIIYGLWETRAYLSFINNLLVKICLQVLDNENISLWFFSQCYDAIGENYNNYLISTETNNIVWKNHNSLIKLSYKNPHCILMYSFL
jgi:hypothetical protein